MSLCVRYETSFTQTHRHNCHGSLANHLCSIHDDDRWIAGIGTWYDFGIAILYRRWCGMVARGDDHH